MAPTTSRTSFAVEADAGSGQSAADRIRLRAYEIFKARNGGPGDASADWAQAERELQAGSDAKR
jgi:hypothetical protein